MEHPPISPAIMELEGLQFEIIKPKRLKQGMVLKHEDTYARVGPKLDTLEEQLHTVSLFNRGFPVPEVVSSGELPDDQWYYTEKSLGEEPFHKIFSREFAQQGSVSADTFDAYMTVIDRYLNAQLAPQNQSDVRAVDFVSQIVNEEYVLPTYEFCGKDPSKYREAIAKATEALADAKMGILQFDLNPYNMLRGGIIDFELVGYGPLGYDSLLSIRWGIHWFTDYPSKYPTAYKLSTEFLERHDEFVAAKFREHRFDDPRRYMNEFMLIKSAWGVHEEIPPQADWPQKTLAFRQYRSNVLEHCVDAYLEDQAITSDIFPAITGGELQ